MKKPVAVLTAIAPSDASVAADEARHLRVAPILPTLSSDAGIWIVGKCCSSEASAASSQLLSGRRIARKIRRQELRLLIVSGTTINKKIATASSNPKKTIEIASGLGMRRSSRAAIGCTPNAMNAAMTKIEIVRGMCARKPKRGQQHDDDRRPRSSDAPPEVGSYSALHSRRRSVR